MWLKAWLSSATLSTRASVCVCDSGVQFFHKGLVLHDISSLFIAHVTCHVMLCQAVLTIMITSINLLFPE